MYVRVCFVCVSPSDAYIVRKSQIRKWVLAFCDYAVGFFKTLKE